MKEPAKGRKSLLTGGHAMPKSQFDREKLDAEGSEFIQNVLQIAVFVAVVGAFLLFALFIYFEWTNPAWRTVAFDHFPATVGLPAAAAGAFVVCALFRTAEGKIKFAVFNVHFEGASGPIVMWVLCFLAIAAAIRMLWPLKP
jgi:hypothetical protein